LGSNNFEIRANDDISLLAENIGAMMENRKVEK